MPLLRLWNREELALASNAVLLGLLIAALGLLCATTPAGAELEKDLGLRWLFGTRGPVAPPNDVVIVAIDEESSHELLLQDRPSSWPRSLHAELVRYLAKSGASVIAFDLTFDVPGVKPEQDVDFANAIRAAGNVLLAESIRRDTLRIPGTDPANSGMAIVESRSAPVAILKQASRGSAPFILPKDARVDTYWPFLDDGLTMPTLPVLAFHAFADAALHKLGDMQRAGTVRSITLAEEIAGSPKARALWSQRLRNPSDVELPEETKRLGRNLLDLYASAESRYLNFYGPPRTVKTVSYSDVMTAARSRARRDRSLAKRGSVQRQGRLRRLRCSDTCGAGSASRRLPYRLLAGERLGLERRRDRSHCVRQSG